MPLSKNVIEKESADVVAINYKPKMIGSIISEQGLIYAHNKDKRGDFRMDKIVTEFVGIDEIEKESQQREIADEAIKLSREVQENAYKEAYALGLKQGKEFAFLEEKENIENEMNNFKNLIEETKHIKTNLMKNNEKQIVQLCFYMAKRLLMKEIQTDEEYVKTLIKKTLEMAQAEEEVTVRVSVKDKAWIETCKESLFKDLNIGSNTRIEEDKTIQPGGVVVETHYGVIDAQVEQRLDKLEAILKEHS